MEDRGRAGITTFVMRGKPYLVAIMARGGLLRAYTRRFADELRSIAEVQVDAAATVDDHTVTTFQRHIEALRGDTLEASDLEHSHSHELRTLIEKKRKSETSEQRKSLRGKRPTRVRSCPRLRDSGARRRDAYLHPHRDVGEPTNRRARARTE